MGCSPDRRRFSCQRCGLKLVMISKHGDVTFSFDMTDWESRCLDPEARSPLACLLLISPIVSKSERPH